MTTNDMLTVIYCNLNRTGVAHDMFNSIGDNIGADIFCCSEPNRRLAKLAKDWMVDDKIDTAQWTYDGEGHRRGSGNGFVWTVHHDTAIYSCYISPNVPLTDFDDFLKSLGSSIDEQAKSLDVLVVGDFNAWATVWGSRTTNSRGERVLDWMEKNKLTLLNDGLTPTFVKGEMEAYIDLTFCSERLVTKIRHWGVMDEVDCTSDHLPILVKIGLSNRGEKFAAPPRLKKYQESHRIPLKEHIGRISAPEGEGFMDAVLTGCKEVIGLTYEAQSRTPKYWWNEEIAARRKECIKARRTITRANRDGSCSQLEKKELGEIHRTAQKMLRDAIRSSKQVCWEKEVEKLRINPWGTAFRIATGRAKTRKKVNEAVQLGVVRDLFPVHDPPQYACLPNHDAPDDFTLFELWAAIGRTKMGRAPGPDGLSPELARAVCLHNPEKCLEMFNDFLRRGEFPKMWKRANLLVIPKPKKERTSQQTYRPICLIDTMGKVMEHLLQRRLRAEMGRELSERQFGYRPGKSTVDALCKVYEFGKGARKAGKYAALVALDIRNAFNSASWQRIDEALERMGTPIYLRAMTRSYLSERTIIVEGKEIPISAGVPQGSVLGPLLWCVLYNDVLEMDLGIDAELSCYADDLAVLVAGKTKKKVTGRTNRVTAMVIEKLTQLGLTIATNKTEIVMLSSKMRATPLAFKINGHPVSSQESTKYLGVWVSRDLHLGQHMKETASKADKAAMALSSLMPNRGGPSQATRRMFARGVYSICLYAAPAWYESISAKAQLGDLERSVRRILIRVCCGYSSLSRPAAEVIAGIPPAQLLAKERHLRYGGVERRVVLQGTRRDWKACWGAETRAEWTRRLIPNLDLWLDRRHGEVTSYVCQLIGGCGAFRAHLKKIGVRATDECVFCHEVDTAEHALFRCRRFRWLRSRLEDRLGAPLQPETVVGRMCGDGSVWREVAEYVSQVMRSRDMEERVRGG